MSDPRLPPEILDNVVDLLHDESDALKVCCLASKSWISRTRKHLFAHVDFPTAAYLESWKETFPDPSISPACYTRTLIIECADTVRAADAEEGGCIAGIVGWL